MSLDDVNETHMIAATSYSQDGLIARHLVDLRVWPTHNRGTGLAPLETHAYRPKAKDECDPVYQVNITVTGSTQKYTHQNAY